MRSKILDYFNLHNGEEDKEEVLQSVKKSISFKGSNLWVLACAIVVASIGLNVNSTAVIIGAMLISPLMSPIVAAGFALGTYDFDLLKRAGKNLLIATIVSLLVATIYFYISPFKETQSELLARTSPNIYDVLIAFFGGLVGVIALTRVEKGNPIPGVAIATALMPPLCTAGYGLAIGNFQYFFGAFYLYTINCFFICIATLFIIKFLKYPPVNIVRLRLKKQIRMGISILIFVMIVPSFLLAYNLFHQRKFTQKAEQFITNEFFDNTIVYKKINFNKDPKTIELAFLNADYTEEEIFELNEKLKVFGLKNTELIIKQDYTAPKNELEKKLEMQSPVIKSMEKELKKTKTELSTFKMDDNTIEKELKILFPEVTNFSWGKHLIKQENDETKTVTVFVYQIQGKVKSLDKAKLELWFKEKTNSSEVKLIQEK